MSEGTYADGDGTALATLLDGQRVRLAQVGAPETAANGDNAQLGDDDGGTNGSGNLLGGLDAETDVALGVTNDDNGLETGTLTGTGLLLDRLDLLVIISALLTYSMHLKFSHIEPGSPQSTMQSFPPRFPLPIGSA